MSAWPNAAFDLCGICCGHFQMPFWSFFGGTLAGKAGVKAVFQCIFFTTVFSPKYLDQLLALMQSVGVAGACTLVGQPPCNELFKTIIDKQILKFNNPEVFKLLSGGPVKALLQAGPQSCEQLWGQLQSQVEYSQSYLCETLQAATTVGLLQESGQSYSVTEELMKGEPLPKVLFGYFVMLVMLWFVMTTIEQFAQIYAQELDEDEVDTMREEAQAARKKK